MKIFETTQIKRGDLKIMKTHMINFLSPRGCVMEGKNRDCRIAILSIRREKNITMLRFVRLRVLIFLCATRCS